MYIGIDLGGTNIAAGLVDDSCRIKLKKSIPTGAEREPEAVIRDIAMLALGIIKEAGIKKEDIKAVGIGTPGSVDDARGMVIYANNLGFRNTPMAAILKKYYDVPVYLGNDADCAALGEAYAGASKNCEHSVMITLGTGVGGGIIINKKPYSGFNHAGGELGHMVIEYNGRLCTCGRRGCWEAYSSATGLIAMTAEAMQKYPDSILWTMHDDKVENISGKSAFIAARKGDAAGVEVVETYTRYLACGLTNIINIFQPEVLSIGGGVSHEGPYLLDPVIKIIEEERYSKDMEQTRVVLAELGNDAGIIGAAMLGKGR